MKLGFSYDDMTQDEFTSILEKIVSELTTADLMTLPGFYEIVSEEFNNEVLTKWAERKTVRLCADSVRGVTQSNLDINYELVDAEDFIQSLDQLDDEDFICADVPFTDAEDIDAEYGIGD